MSNTVRRFFTSGLMLLLALGATTLVPFQAYAPPTCTGSNSPAWQICGPIQSPTSSTLQTTALQANDGTLRIAWTGHPNSNYQIFYANRLLNGTWNSGVTVTTQGGFNQDPALAQLANNTLLLFWAYKSTSSSHYQLYYLVQNGGSFSKIYRQVPLTNPTSLNDTLPSAAVGKDGTLWLVWTRDNSTLAGTTPVMRQLWYKTLKAGVWSTEQPITLSNDTNWNYQPSVMVGKDGVVRVAYSRGVPSTAVFQINYITFNGSSWSSPVSLTSDNTSTQDDNPSIVQDRNGTLWIFWARNVPQGTTSSAFIIYEISSTNNGTPGSWSSETQLTIPSCNTSGCVDSEYPAAVQSSYDKYLWLFYATDPGVFFNIYALQTVARISPVHDVSISSYTTNATYFGHTCLECVYQSGFHDPYTSTGLPISLNALVQVSVNVWNFGDYNETVTLNVKATNTTSTNLGTQILQIPTNPTGTLYTATFYFNTTSVKPARYGFSGNASIPRVSVGNKPDGLFAVPNLVHVIPLGDIDQDGSVTLIDFTVVLYNYGYSCLTPATCSPRYTAAQWGDIDGNGALDIIDVGIILANYNTYT